MSEDQRHRGEGVPVITIQVDPPPGNQLGHGHRSNNRPSLPTLPAGIIVNEFQETGDQTEVNTNIPAFLINCLSLTFTADGGCIPLQKTVRNRCSDFSNSSIWGSNG